jgi:hypothetical protein
MSTVLVPCGKTQDQHLKVSFVGSIGFGREALIAAASAVRDLPTVEIVSRELALASPETAPDDDDTHHFGPWLARRH